MLDQGAPAGRQHPTWKFSCEMALVQLSCAFRLCRLARNVVRSLGLGHPTHVTSSSAKVHFLSAGSKKSKCLVSTCLVFHRLARPKFRSIASEAEITVLLCLVLSVLSMSCVFRPDVLCLASVSNLCVCARCSAKPSELRAFKASGLRISCTV